jgi:uncharacterized membrane protein HdeD (DUF308 family)
MSIGRKIGRFLVVLGCGLIGFFVLTDLARQANFGTLFIGAMILIGGIFLMVSNPNPEQHQAPRFRTLNKILQKDEKQQQQRKEKK